MGVYAGFLLLCALLVGNGAPLLAQNTTTGEIVGTVQDPSGAVIGGATIQLRSLAQNETRGSQTSSSGSYRFSLLAPGKYELKAEAKGFQTLNRTVEVALGVTQTVNLQLTLGSTSQVVTVTEQAPLLQASDASVSTTISEVTAQNVPNPGNDITYSALMTPGTTENTSSGYGNFAANGISGTSNLFTVNGMDYNDPYLNLNNSGATNLSLGQNEIQEVNVVTNGYGGEFGGLAGSNVNISTRSGTNDFHGDLKYFWDGRTMNANSFFNNASGTPRSFVNANQYGGDVGGPIVKNKLFGYFNTEGLYLVIPTSVKTVVPTQRFETDTIESLQQAGLTSSAAFYQNMFNLYNNAPGISRALPGNNPSDPIGCQISQPASGQPAPPLLFPTVDPAFGNGLAGVGNAAACAQYFFSNVSAKTHEQLYSFRIDYNIGAKDTIYGRYQQDKGVQASYTDPINPAFNAVSNQPEYQGQINETHFFGATAVNQAILSGQWYSAPFSQPDPEQAYQTFPTTLTFNNGLFSNMGGLDYIFPQGRNVTQAQFSDDFSKSFSKHTLKAGIKFRRNDVTDSSFSQLGTGLLISLATPNFIAGGQGDVLEQQFAQNDEQRFTFWQLGGYLEDDYKMRPNLTLTFALRLDHAANPSCKANCFSDLVEPFPNLVNDSTLGGANAANVPYNQIIQSGQSTALRDYTQVEWAPRVGFAWQPNWMNRSVVVRGGFGIFYDAFPGQIVDNLAGNAPNVSTYVVQGGYYAPGETTGPGSLFTIASNSNSAFVNGYPNGITLAELQASDPFFAPPSFTYTPNYTQIPYYEKWSLQVEKQFGANTSLTVGYVGNHGLHETALYNGVNAFDPDGYVGLPETAPDPRFNVVTGAYNNAISSYNGMTVSVVHRYSSGQLGLNYTYSHALDEISNGGFSTFASTNFGATNNSIQYPQYPYNLRANYGNADYDVRHQLNLNYVWELPLKKLTWGHGPDALLKGWQVAGTAFVRSGLPFTAVDLTTSGTLSNTGYGGTVFASPLGMSTNQKCSGVTSAGPTCIASGLYGESASGFGTLGRNTLRGPNYFDSDFSLMKYLRIPKWEQARFGLGAQFYNVFNHPNFDIPVANVGSSAFGQIIRTVSGPTTPFGAVLGADASPRIIQLKAQFSF
jgi:outer membrane receptor protein involved in Fe transport